MAIWIVLAAMTAAAIFAVLWPLSRRVGTQPAGDPNTRFYRDQMGEIDRDVERGLLSPAEAEAARAEAARRMLRAAERQGTAAAAVCEPSLRRRRAVSALALSVVPLVALATYGALGSPHLAGSPRPAASATAPAEVDLSTALARIEAHLAQNPQDGRGWEVVAPVYLRLGRAQDAAQAFERAIRLLGAEPGRLAQYGEALVVAEQGIVSSAARQAFETALQQDPSTPKARFYLARAAEQDGDREGARGQYEALLASSPADAPWTGLVREKLASLGGEASAPPSIAGMVGGLAARLDAQGGTAEEWGRLVRSYVVLDEKMKAEDALARGRRALAADQGALANLEATARELKLSTSTAR